MRHDRSPPGRGHDQANPSSTPRQRNLRPAVLEPAFTVTVGFYPDGTLGEVFIDSRKTGQDVQSTASDAAVVLSLALQHGAPIEAIRHAVTRNGSGEAASILGAVVDRLATVSVRAAEDRA